MSHTRIKTSFRGCETSTLLGEISKEYKMKFKEFAIMMLNISAVYSATSEGRGLTNEQGSVGQTRRRAVVVRQKYL